MLFKYLRSRIAANRPPPDPLGPGHISMAWLNFNGAWDFKTQGTLRLPLEPPHKGHAEIKMDDGRLVGSIPGTDLVAVLWNGDWP